MLHNTYDVLHGQQEGKCAICNKPLTDTFHTHIDHIIRRKDNGPDDIENLRLICLPCDWEREGNAPNSQYPELMTSYKMYKFWQTEKGRMDRKIKACQGDVQGTTKSPYFDAVTLITMMDALENSAELEKQYEKEVKQVLKEIPAAVKLQEGWGAGPLVVAHIMSSFDIRKGNRVSGLWKFFGYTPEQSAGAKGRNPGLGQLRAPLYASLSISLTRKSSPYREFYLATRKRMEDNGRDKTHGPALQRTIKLWLSHFWDTWRRLEGLPVSEPYAISQLGHDGFISPQDYGWNI